MTFQLRLIYFRDQVRITKYITATARPLFLFSARLWRAERLLDKNHDVEPLLGFLVLVMSGLVSLALPLR